MKKFKRTPLNKTILFLGGPRDSVPFIARTWALGYDVIIVDQDSNCPGFVWAAKMQKKWSDTVWLIKANVYDYDEVMEYTEGFHFEGVLAVATDVGPVVSLVAESMGLPHIPHEITKLGWDKALLKLKFIELGIPTPALAQYIKKPRYQGRGSSQVQFEVITQTFGDEFIYEEWVKGNQYSVECIIHKGLVIFTGMTKRDYPNPLLFVERGGWSWHVIPVRGRQATKKVCYEAIKKLGIQNGTIKFDIVMDGDQPLIIEAAIGRLGGGQNGDLYLALSYGIDFVGTVCAIAVGDSPSPSLIRGDNPLRVVRGLYDISGNPQSNKERGRFKVGVGQTMQEAERKVQYDK